MGRGEGAGGKGRSTVSLAELARHNRVGDAWISIYGKVSPRAARRNREQGPADGRMESPSGGGGSLPFRDACGPLSHFASLRPPFAQVYDISTWTDHPGGRVIMSAAGQDATDTFKAFHSPRADGMLKRELETRIVGDLEETTATTAAAPATKQGGATAPKSYVNVPFEEGYRELYKKIKERRLMEAR